MKLLHLREVVPTDVFRPFFPSGYGSPDPSILDPLLLILAKGFPLERPSESRKPVFYFVV
jgi:hypothetical protein